MSNRPQIGVILGGVREGRTGQVIADRVLGHTTGYQLIDLAEHALPQFSEPVPAFGREGSEK
ncbi:MAG: hypothetical protein QOI78_4396 [Actinomycetota bacterium]|nr:hypothetical protein [Actinomycetota bacterium]